MNSSLPSVAHMLVLLLPTLFAVQACRTNPTSEPPERPVARVDPVTLDWTSVDAKWFVLDGGLDTHARYLVNFESRSREGGVVRTTAIAYVPKNPTSWEKRAIVWNHGAGSGTSALECTNESTLASYARKTGWLVMGPDYHGGDPELMDGGISLDGGHPWPRGCHRVGNEIGIYPDFYRTRVNDIYSAILALRQKMQEQWGASGPIYLMGHSYGGAFTLLTLDRMTEANVAHYVEKASVRASVWDEGARMIYLSGVRDGGTPCPHVGATCRFTYENPAGGERLEAETGPMGVACDIARWSFGGDLDQGCQRLVDDAPNRHVRWEGDAGTPVQRHTRSTVPLFVAGGVYDPLTPIDQALSLRDHLSSEVPPDSPKPYCYREYFTEHRFEEICSEGITCHEIYLEDAVRFFLDGSLPPRSTSHGVGSTRCGGADAGLE